jgi:hypothetical protein
MVGIRMVKLRALIKLMRATIQKVERMGWQIREVYVRITHCWGRRSFRVQQKHHGISVNRQFVCAIY